MNILLLSVGTRNKIVQYFKQELTGIGKVIATDCSGLSPALYDADAYYIVDPITADGYIEEILKICKKEDISAALSLIDPELSLLAAHKQAFLEQGVTLILSDYEKIELCSNKYAMYKYLLKNDFKTVRSYIDKAAFYADLQKSLLHFPVFIKPIKGSASFHIYKAYSHKEVDVLFEKYSDLIIQEFVNGTEYGADVYVDMIAEEPVAIFTKEKIKMRAGETDKSVSFKDQKLFDLIERFVKAAGLKGVIDMDIFKIDNEYRILEVNPRFGGGYPHAYESGVNMPGMIMNNIKGYANKSVIGEYREGIYMMKYNELKVIDRSAPPVSCCNTVKARQPSAV